MNGGQIHDVHDGTKDVHSCQQDPSNFKSLFEVDLFL